MKNPCLIATAIRLVLACFALLPRMQALALPADSAPTPPTRCCDKSSADGPGRSDNSHRLPERAAENSVDTCHISNRTHREIQYRWFAAPSMIRRIVASSASNAGRAECLADRGRRTRKSPLPPTLFATLYSPRCL